MTWFFIIIYREIIIIFYFYISSCKFWLLKNGNNIQNLPEEIKNCLKNLNFFKNSIDTLVLKDKIIKLHSEIVHLPDGRDMEFILTVNLIFTGLIKSK